MALLVKNPPVRQAMPVQIPGWEGSPGGGNGNPFHTVAWRIPWKRSLVGYSSWGYRVGHDLACTRMHALGV